jgi:heme exporter protein D
MRWDSWADFWHMGGYAVYVWGSVGVSFALLALEVWWVRRVRARTLAWLRAEQLAKAHDPAGAQP